MHPLPTRSLLFFPLSSHFRWEAAQIPNVKVAELDKSKLNKEQSVYMPVIPEIAKCPEHLMPSKQWEDEFLADFSKLRLVCLSYSIFVFFGFFSDLVLVPCFLLKPVD